MSGFFQETNIKRDLLKTVIVALSHSRSRWKQDFCANLINFPVIAPSKAPRCVDTRDWKRTGVTGALKQLLQLSFWVSRVRFWWRLH